MTSLTALVEHSEPRATSPDISMIPAPVIAVTSAPTSHSRFVSQLGVPVTDEQSEDPQPPLTAHCSLPPPLPPAPGWVTEVRGNCGHDDSDRTTTCPSMRPWP